MFILSEFVRISLFNMGYANFLKFEDGNILFCQQQYVVNGAGKYFRIIHVVKAENVRHPKRMLRLLVKQALIELCDLSCFFENITIRKSMSKVRLNSVFVCHVHQDILNIRKLAADFAGRSDFRKVTFCNCPFELYIKCFSNGCTVQTSVIEFCIDT